MNAKREYAIDAVIETLNPGTDVTVIRDRDNSERAIVITESAMYVIQAGERYTLANVTRSEFNGSQSHLAVDTAPAVVPSAMVVPLPKSPCYCDSRYHPQGC